MTPKELTHYLNGLIQHDVRLSTMIWGAPGIGKSSIVAQIAELHDLEVIDLRLSQLAPTDLRGLPVAENGLAKWFPPEFLPNTGKGILFLDEINMASPAMQGIAQQLILDRQVGTYRVPEGWFVWAAGNRKSDRAAVFEMPSALANRFIHLDLVVDLDSFKSWGLRNGISEEILAFLSFRPALLHSLDAKSVAWPSPRSWFMADRLKSLDLSIETAVGIGPCEEFNAFCAVYDTLPDLELILSGQGKVKFPIEPSARYATVLGLVVRMQSAEQGVNGLLWLVKNAESEWVQFYANDLFKILRDRGEFGELVKIVTANPILKDFLRDMRDLAYSI